jgi:hypothetical protein
LKQDKLNNNFEMGGNVMNRRVPERIMSWWDQMQSNFTNWYKFRREPFKNNWIIVLNNIIMLLFHLLILIITTVVQVTFITDYLNALYIGNGIIILIYQGFWLIFPLILYLSAGYLLTLTRNIFTDFASTILFSSIGVFIWIYCIQHPNWDNSQWLFYEIYTIGTSHIGNNLFKCGNNVNLGLLDIIIPMFMCFLGMELKRFANHRKTKSKVGSRLIPPRQG